MLIFRKSAAVLVSLAALAAITLQPISDARSSDPTLDIHRKLSKGEVVVDLQTVGDHKFVVGKIIVDQPADRVWPIMTNPFEYERKICPRVKKVEVMVDKEKLSLMKYKLDCTMFLPEINYVVESNYTPNSRIDFHRVSGTIRDFKGFWALESSADGQHTQVTYSMYLDPGFPVPQWIIREGVKVELPKTLQALRRRIDAVCNQSEQPETRSILAASHHKPKMANLDHHHN